MSHRSVRPNNRATTPVHEILQYSARGKNPPQLHRLGSVDSVIGNLRFDGDTRDFCDSSQQGPEPSETSCTPAPGPCANREVFSDLLMRRRKFGRFLPDTSASSSPAPESCRFYADYIEHSLVGRGSSCEVFRVRHRIDDCVYAVKRSIPGDSRGARSMDQLISEARILAQLTSQGRCHNIVQYYTSFIEESRFFLVTELCDMSVRDAFMKFGRFHEDVLVDFIHDVARALGFCHDRLTVHLDVSPSNVMLTARRRFKLADWGLAVNLDCLDSSVDIASGDSRYLASEVLTGRVEDLTKVDIFALGASALACAIGADLPAEGPQWELIRKDPSLAKQHLECSVEVSQTVQATLLADPTQRPSASDLLATDWIRDHALEVSIRE